MCLYFLQAGNFNVLFIFNVYISRTYLRSTCATVWVLDTNNFFFETISLCGGQMFEHGFSIRSSSKKTLEKTDYVTLFFNSSIVHFSYSSFMIDGCRRKT